MSFVQFLLEYDIDDQDLSSEREPFNPSSH